MREAAKNLWQVLFARSAKIFLGRIPERKKGALWAKKCITGAKNALWESAYISDTQYFWYPIFFRYPIYLIPDISDMVPDISDTRYLLYPILMISDISDISDVWIYSLCLTGATTMPRAKKSVLPYDNLLKLARLLFINTRSNIII